MGQYNQKEVRKLFEGLPDNLKDALLSESTANTISDISKRYEIEEEKISRLAELIGNVLMGILPPEELPETLVKELQLEEERARKISQEINRFILYPVKGSLAEFYKIEFAPGGRITTPKPTEEKIPPREKLGIPSKEKGKPTLERKKPAKEDVYREPVE